MLTPFSGVMSADTSMRNSLCGRGSGCAAVSQGDGGVRQARSGEGVYAVDGDLSARDDNRHGEVGVGRGVSDAVAPGDCGRVVRGVGRSAALVEHGELDGRPLGTFWRTVALKVEATERDALLVRLNPAGAATPATPAVTV